MTSLNRSTSTILVMIFLSNTIYGLGAPFLPKLLAQKDIDQVWTGIIFAVYAVSQVCFALICGKIVDRLGHRKVMVVGALTMAAAVAAFGIVSYLDSKWQINTLCIALRAFQGASSGFINTAAYSYAAQAFKDDVGKMIGILETVASLGITMGPFLGLLVYGRLGFAWTFLIFGLTMVPAGLLILCIATPADLAKQHDSSQCGSTVANSEEDSESLSLPGNVSFQETATEPLLIPADDKGEVALQKLTYGSIFCMARVFFAAMSGMVGCMYYCVFDPTLALRMDHYGLSQTFQGVIFTVMPFSYMLGTLFTSYLLPKWIEIRVTLITGSLLLGLSILLIGPVFEERNPDMMVIGIALSFILIGPACIQNISEMMRVVEHAFPTYDLEHANSLLSGIVNGCFGVGMAAGPLMGSSLYQIFGFRIMCNVTGGITVFFALTYFFFCNGREAYISTYRNLVCNIVS
mmetsp:Transcript_25968/g.51767  ORF Transcript_25968/g.51767 Transcript_25968/m.51767 type:complete len:462 (-) Transcript_25968:248-1633(-)|eukprot:CAMPEP_0194303708 /NCGR_PEP_ID=MMETSP0171-20130528/1535_1 /TAXON_ID=218684 /ORGANISM="Corethron pennatum, Strain L29A3" /LENGTH=461 /DNA_ID=CAMNT_0039054709 /DNA_START=62 /DNA_END=1447 /DNA_ORIENTATION=-